MDEIEIKRKIILPDGPVLLIASGEITGKEIIQALQNLLNDPDFKPNIDSIWDFRSVTTRLIDAQEITDLINFVRTIQEKRGRDYRVAIIVTRDMDYGLARMFEVHSQDLPFQVRIFEDLEQAKSWLKPRT
jgi:hypothetical protein